MAPPELPGEAKGYDMDAVSIHPREHLLGALMVWS
jgi:hypothetical protein